MVLPLISGVIGLVIIGVVGGGWALTPFAVEPGPAMYVPLFFFYVVMYAIGIFFQAAVIAGATERMRGGDPTIGSALAAATSKAGPILMWALVSATVGVILRAIQTVCFIGKIVTGLAGAAWAWQRSSSSRSGPRRSFDRRCVSALGKRSRKPGEKR